MDLYLSTQIAIALVAIITVIFTIRDGNKKGRREQNELLYHLGFKLSRSNSELTKRNEELLQQISELSRSNSDVGIIRDIAHKKFKDAEKENDAKCSAHMQLDAQRELCYETLKKNNDTIITLVKEIQANNKSILSNNSIADKTQILH